MKVERLEFHFLICKMKNCPMIWLCSNILELPKGTQLVSSKSLPGTQVFGWSVPFIKANFLTGQGRRRTQHKHLEADVGFSGNLLTAHAGCENHEGGRPRTPQSHTWGFLVPAEASLSALVSRAGLLKMESHDLSASAPSH